jgi:hypothetical protein
VTSNFESPEPIRRSPISPDNAQARCDAIQAEFRALQSHGDLPPSPFASRREHGVRKSIRRDPPPLPAALIPTEDLLSLRLSEELDYARRMLDTMGDALTSDPNLLMRHGTALQSIDIVGQILGHIAAVVRSSDPAGAVERIGMSELKGRLKRTSIG